MEWGVRAPRDRVPTEDKGATGKGVCISELGWRGDGGLNLRNKAMRSRPMEAPRRAKEKTAGITRSYKSFGWLSGLVTPNPGRTGCLFCCLLFASLK